MSNQAVGQVYSQIIDDVINSSRTDFEDNGVEEGVLEELRKGWQKKLSQLQVASFPWEPKAEPAAAVNNTAASSAAPATTGAIANSNPAPYTQATLSPPVNAQPLQPIAQSANGPAQVKPEPAGQKPEPTIKQEPGLHNPAIPPNHGSFAPGSGAAGGAARAGQLLQANFGQRAAASISAIQGGVNQANPAQGQQGMRPVGQGQQQPINPQQQYRNQMLNQTQQQQQRAQHAGQVNQANGVAHSQVDGAGDAFDGVLMQRSSDGGSVELGRVQIDSMLHEQIAARARQMEGGGLMLPLKQATKHKAAVSKKAGSSAGIPQLDGEGGIKAEDEDADGEIDEDAINSDLDDPEDDVNDSDEDDDMGPIMLCMYDKVQRVKNKWKCTLKDGVLTVNGKEYVFHKATGEYEW